MLLKKKEKEIIAQIREIIIKEDDRYHLSEYQFIHSREDIITEICNKEIVSVWEQEDDFSRLKTNVLNHFYSHYVTVENQFSITNNIPYNEQWFPVIYKDRLGAIHKYHAKHEIDTIDNEMEVRQGRTIAFKRSKALLQDIVTYCKIKAIKIPENIEEKILEEYPINAEKLTDRLEKEDKDLWDEIADYLKLIAPKVPKNGRFYFPHKENINIRTGKYVGNAYESVKRLVTNGNAQEKKTGLEYRKFLYWTSVNAVSNALKKENVIKEHHHYTDSIDDVFPPVKNHLQIEDYVLLYEVDVKNSREVTKALLDLLWNKKPVNIYHELVKGHEDRVQTFLMFFDEDMSYKEIAEHYNNTLTEEKLRQDVSRLKKDLIKRLKHILKHLNRNYNG
ncbi:sigma-70 family RNA polymerase sigma factor [Paludibacter sp. 221]|uniref:sigma-70 family RNA polymerase sigma factor n=1 Tax=Paludibacter sp. 221 TaxID=2302939 RepID=UPI0013CFBD6A|nr:sigma-70 family RNA polymerase sigma factor [Paludibacter sp. 221]NDV45988.1 sigma-70 family RNA polymerase sigma factor [Paludibacter sp. 221]